MSHVALGLGLLMCGSVWQPWKVRLWSVGFWYVGVANGKGWYGRRGRVSQVPVSRGLVRSGMVRQAMRVWVRWGESRNVVAAKVR